MTKATLDTNAKPWVRLMLLGVLLLGTLVRLPFIHGPSDPGAIHSDHLVDAAETEFPFLHWLAAGGAQNFGEPEDWLRSLSAFFHIASLLVFARIAQRLLAAPGALAATALFAANPLLVTLASSVRPDGFMELLSLLAVNALLDWNEHERLGSLLLASIWLALAFLTKTSAMHLGFFFALVALRKLGKRAFTSPLLYASACIMILPFVTWRLWLTTDLAHNAHLLSNFATFLHHPWESLVSNLRTEYQYVFTGAGFVLLFMMLLQPAPKVVLPLAWYASALAVLLLMPAQASNEWALYDHCISVAPACVLLGAGTLSFLDPQNVYRVATRVSQRAGRISALLFLGLTLMAFVHRAHDLWHHRMRQGDLHSSYDSLFGKHKSVIAYPQPLTR